MMIWGPPPEIDPGDRDDEAPAAEPECQLAPFSGVWYARRAQRAEQSRWDEQAG